MTNRQRQPKEPHTSAHSGTWVAAALHCIVCLNEQVQSRSVQGQWIQYLWRRSTCHWPSVLPGSAPRALFLKRLLTSQSPAQAGVCRAVVSRYSMGLCLASKQTGENKWGFFLRKCEIREYTLQLHTACRDIFQKGTAAKKAHNCSSLLPIRDSTPPKGETKDLWPCTLTQCVDTSPLRAHCSPQCPILPTW